MLKKYFALVLILSLLISAGALQGPAQAKEYTVYVISNTLPVYSKVSTSSKVLGTMAFGESMTCLATNSGWAAVRNENGAIGYCTVNSLSTTNPNKYSVKIYITESNVPIYRRPNTSASVMTNLEKGSSYTAVAKTTDGNWARLQNGKYYGYVQMKYISLSESGDTGESNENLNKTVYISDNTLAVYDKASTSGKKLGTMAYGESMTLLAVSGDWAQVRNAAGAIGYCSRSGLTTTNPNKYSQKIYISTDNAPVYRRPDTSSTVMQHLNKNESYTAVAITQDKKWLRLKNGSSYGYLQVEYASDSIEEDNPQETKVYVSATTLKIYSGPSTSKKLLGTVPFGESMILVAVYDGWAQVRNGNGDIGYCAFTGLTNVNPNKYKKTVYVAREGALLYSKPMTTANRVRSLALNEDLLAVAISEDEEWVRILDGGKYVYALIKDLSANKVPENDSDIKDITPITVYVSDTNLPFYKSNSTQSTVLGALSFGASVTCNGTGSGWARVVNSNGAVAYCKSDGLTLTNPNTSGVTFYVQKESVPVYKNASTSSSVLMNLSLNSKVSAVAASSDRSWVRLYNGSQYGYIEAKYLATTPVEDSQQSATIEKVVDLAMSLQGIPYVYAAQSPSEGFDCSGFTYYVYKNAAGITLKRTAKTQGYDETYRLIESKSNLKVGDLVFFNTVSSDDDLCDHVGIYLGNNQFIHASSGAGKVTVSSLGTSDTSYYYRTYSWARRILS